MKIDEIEFLKIKRNLLENKRIITILKKWKMKQISENHYSTGPIQIIYFPNTDETKIYNILDSDLYSKIPKKSLIHFLFVKSGLKKIKKEFEENDSTIEIEFQTEPLEYKYKPFSIFSIGLRILLILMLICVAFIISNGT